MLRDLWDFSKQIDEWLETELMDYCLAFLVMWQGETKNDLTDEVNVFPDGNLLLGYMFNQLAISSESIEEY